MDDGDVKVCVSGGEVGIAYAESVFIRNISAKLPPRSAVKKSAPRIWAKSVFILGGVTEETQFADHEKVVLHEACRQVGGAIAQAGAELIVCSPFADSADVHSVMGYVAAGVGGRINFHSPKHDEVEQKRNVLDAALGQHATEFANWYYPGPENERGWTQAWLLCQIQALMQAKLVVAIGGRTINNASTLLHLAEQFQIPVLPFPFLGGAALSAFKRRDWGKLYPGFDHEKLKEQYSTRDVVNIANRILAPRTLNVAAEGGAPHTFFISRAKKDEAIGGKLAAHFKSLDKACLLGDHEIQDGRMVEPAIHDAILKSDVFIALWSRSYATSMWCNDELEFALKQSKSLKIWIFNIDDTPIIPRDARKLPQIRARTASEITREIQKLLRFPGVLVEQV